MIFMKTKFLPQLFILVFFSFSLYSCTADSVNDTTQKNTVTPKTLAPIADEGSNTIVEPYITKPK